MARVVQSRIDMKKGTFVHALCVLCTRIRARMPEFGWHTLLYFVVYSCCYFKGACSMH